MCEERKTGRIYADHLSPGKLYEALPVLEGDEMLSPVGRLRAGAGPLLSWYESHARVLPWREEPHPYRVWISEIMLQQTRVEAVKPYFYRFMEALPDVKALAQVGDQRLMKLWEGLGYYNRARNLKKAAQVMMEEYRGQLPDSYEELLKLPGIGSYTAGAIASIAFHIPVPAVDGNVLRVISRVLASEEDILKQSVKGKIESYVREAMPKDRASAFNQGLIEIGAMVCVPNGQPKCGECPFSSLCLGRRRGLLDRIPVKTPKKPRKVEERTVLLVGAGDGIAIEKRPDRGLLASLYQFPNVEGNLTGEDVRRLLESMGGQVACLEPAGKAKHIFSHVEWHMTGYLVTLEHAIDSYIFVDRDELREKYPIPNAFSVYRNVLIGES